MLDRDHNPPPNTPPIILVCYHKLSKPIICNAILRPIIVGAANMGDRARILQAQLESKIPKKLRLGGGQAVDENAPALTNAQSDGVCDFGGFQGGSEGIVLRDNEQAPAADSRKSTQKPMPFILRDDSGDNISVLNPNFCELTAMYWAWKNVDASYYGLFHYRRVLDLSPKGQKTHTDYPIILHNHRYNPKRYGLTSDNITKLLQDYNIILPQGYKNHYNLPQDEGLDNYGIYAYYHHAKDLDRIIELIKSRYPEMQSALDSVLFTYPPRWHIANMFIMRKDLYFAYCEWLFSLLFTLSAETDLSDYTPYQARIYGFLSERLFNIWLTYQRQTRTLRILEAPMLLFIEPKPLIGWDINSTYKRFYFLGIRLYKSRIKPKS